MPTHNAQASDLQELQHAACAGRQLPGEDKAEKGASHSGYLSKLRSQNADFVKEKEGENKT
jgi:hypothetical protein